MLDLSDAGLGEGLHPAFPAPPEPLAANFTIAVAPVLGSAAGAAVVVARRLLGLPIHGWGLKGPAYGTLLFLGYGLYRTEIYERRAARAVLDRQGTKIPSRTLLVKNGVVQQDDYLVAGCAIGILCALSKRVAPSTIGWLRYVGAASWGGCGGYLLFTPLNSKVSDPAMDLYTRRVEQARLLQKELAEKHDLTVAAKSLSPFSPSVQQSQDETPETLPHHYGLDPRWGRIFIPSTDYTWVPASSEEGIRTLEEHLKTLVERRTREVTEAEFIWHELADRETAFQCMTDDKARDASRRALELLGSTHHRLWDSISGLDWMIADTKKRILQLEAKQSGRTWTPAPGFIDRAKFRPDLCVEILRRHLSNLEEVNRGFDAAMTDREFSKMPKDAQLTLRGNKYQLLQNIEATKAVIKEFEARLDASSVDEWTPDSKNS